jgi:hypothetical protein
MKEKGECKIQEATGTAHKQNNVKFNYKRIDVSKRCELKKKFKILAKIEVVKV